MKLNKILIGAFFAFALSSIFTSCVDDWKFGDSFLEKAPGGDVTKDTIFNNAEYTREFLWRTYAYMYYGIPYYWDGGVAVKMNTGVFETLSDCWHSHNSWDDVNRLYYPGAYVPGDRGKFGYTNERVWEGVRSAYIFLENVDKTPDMEESEKNRLKAEAKCIIASRYFDMFRHYGGLPIVKNSYSGTDATYEEPRGTVEETVDFMVGLLDEAASNLPWTVEEAWDGRFTKAAAEALKCKILLFAASPLFNSETPCAGSEADAANANHQAWYGDYKAERWQRCLTACEKFFQDLGAEGYYKLVQAEGSHPTSGQYRAAFRAAYSKRGTTEMLMGTRVRYDGNGWTDNAFGGHNYLFVSEWNAYGGYTPTEEFMEMFDWKDGRPFNLDKVLQEDPDTMFVNPDKNFDLTRDPRLYETMIVNGVQTTMNDNGNYSGRRYENWVEGTDGGKGAGTSESGQFATGFANNKFYFNGETNRVHVWPYVRLAEVYLIYAEALAQNGQLDKAINNVNIVRARVGLKGLKESDASKNWGDKQTVLDAIMKERAVEFGFEETRFFDLIRYRRSDIFQKQLHGLRMYRQKDGKDYNFQWQGKQEKENGYEPNYPTHYRYEKYEIQNVRRSWWRNWDNKWFLSAFPPTEINKNYGLTQNPGW